MDATTQKNLPSFKEDQYFPKEIMNLIVTDFVQANNPHDSANLRDISTETREQAILAYRRPLNDLNIDTAEKAIFFAKKYGSKLSFIDISRINFSENQFEELISYLPKINTLIIKNSKISEGMVKAIAASETLSNLITLNLSSNKIGDEGAKAINESQNLKKTKVNF